MQCDAAYDINYIKKRNNTVAKLLQSAEPSVLFDKSSQERSLHKIKQEFIPVNQQLKAFTSLMSIIIVFTVRRYALHGLCDRNSVRPSVRPSVSLSVTLMDYVHMIRPTIMISSPYGSPIILVSGDITFIPKFEGGHPERGR